MQLVEQGKIDLNADVNTYLPDFKIPATLPQTHYHAQPVEPYRRVRRKSHRDRVAHTGRDDFAA